MQVKKRGKSFSYDQDVAICNAWLNITKDPFYGTSQLQPTTVCDRVYQNYTEATGDRNVRSQGSIKARWKKIYWSCSRFRYCLTEIEKKQQNGLPQPNKVLQANRLYCELEKKRFAFNHCWAILQYTMTGQDLTTVKKSDSHKSKNSNTGQDLTIVKKSDSHKSKNSNIHTSSSSQSEEPNTVISIEIDKDPYYETDCRKIKKRRRRAEKEARGESKELGTLNSRFCNLMEQFNRQFEESEKRKAKIAERKLKIMEEMNEREQREKDDQIMSMDTSNMDPRAKLYYEQRKNDVYVKMMTRTLDTSNMDSRARAYYEHSDIKAKMMAHAL